MENTNAQGSGVLNIHLSIISWNLVLFWEPGAFLGLSLMFQQLWNLNIY